MKQDYLDKMIRPSQETSAEQKKRMIEQAQIKRANKENTGGSAN